MNVRPDRSSLRILVVDLETTGDKPRDCSIIEFGAEWLGTGEVYEMRCRPHSAALIQQEAMDYNGCTWHQDPSIIHECEALRHFLDWVGPEPVIIAGHNPYFDLLFLREACERYNYQHPVTRRTLDLHSLAIPHALFHGCEIPPRGFYADDIYEMLGLPAEPKPHRALNGARWEAAALRDLLDMPQILTESTPHLLKEALLAV